MMIIYKNSNKRKGWLKFILLVFCVEFMSCKTHTKGYISNESAIDNIKSNSDKEFIEKNIIGYWEFEKLTLPNGEIIYEQEFQINTIKATGKVSRPNVIFHEDKSYLIIGESKVVIDKGIWSYNKNDRVLKFIFDKPKYSVPIDKIPPKLFDELKKEGSIVEFNEDNWEIHQITGDKLSIIEHLPHNEFELKYNLRVYKKRK